MRSTCLPAAFFCLCVACGEALAEPDLSGVWVLEGRAAERELVMTEKALAIQEDYDLLNDDPSLECEPASLSRVWANPNSRFRIEQDPDEIRISYELFDLRRTIPVVQEDVVIMSDQPSTRNLDGQYFQKMGSSVARYEDDRLVIRTNKHSFGYIRTSRGIPQSSSTIATEELWIDGDTLHLMLTYEDESLFRTPFIIDHVFERMDSAEILPYNCEGADYDWFEKLNPPADGNLQ